MPKYVDWDRRHAAALAPQEPWLAVDRSTARRLRVGYVSADFRQHAVAWFAEPLLAAHDRGHASGYSAIQVGHHTEHCHSAFPRRTCRALAQHPVGLDDAAVAELIRRDGIDVLVDVTGHTAGSRLLVFARRPAPVQIEYLQ